MKLSEIIAANRDKITELCKVSYADVIRSNGDIESQIYVADDGNVHGYDCPSGSNGYLADTDLHFVLTVKARNFYWQDCCAEPVPDESEFPEEYAAMRDETIDWIIESYDPSDDISHAIEMAELDERFHNC